MEIRLNESLIGAAENKVRDMCEKLLANPVIEEYSYELAEIDES